MNEILIKGMGMPKTEKDSFVVIVKPNGIIYHFHEDELKKYKAVELPPHGRLGDLDKMRSDFEVVSKDYPEVWKLVSGIIDRTPTVVEATE